MPGISPFCFSTPPIVSTAGPASHAYRRIPLPGMVSRPEHLPKSSIRHGLTISGSRFMGVFVVISASTARRLGTPSRALSVAGHDLLPYLVGTIGYLPGRVFHAPPATRSVGRSRRKHRTQRRFLRRILTAQYRVFGMACEQPHGPGNASSGAGRQLLPRHRRAAPARPSCCIMLRISP